MSWDIQLVNDGGDPVIVEPHTEGGTYAVGGTNRADLNVTWNYSYFYYNEIDEDDGIRWLDGKTAAETVGVLKDAVETLGTEPHNDCESYWCPSMGRAGAALDTLLTWAKDHPDAEWRIIG